MWVEDPMTIDNEDIRTMYEAREDDEYRWWQQRMTDSYRSGEPNAGLPPDVVQAIQWMAGTPQFLSHSGLQIVPVSDEKLAELERWLKIEREWRMADAKTIDSAMRFAMCFPFPRKPELGC
jgi:hypothetical protein